VLGVSSTNSNKSFKLIPDGMGETSLEFRKPSLSIDVRVSLAPIAERSDSHSLATNDIGLRLKVWSSKGLSRDDFNLKEMTNIVQHHCYISV